MDGRVFRRTHRNLLMPGGSQPMSTPRVMPVRGPGTLRVPARSAFTLIEILTVLVIVGVLLGLLLPAIQGAIRTAKAAAVTAEIEMLGQALAQFKVAYGEYPPSRIMLIENGLYAAPSTPLAVAGTTDITRLQLVQRSRRYLNRFWPRMPLFSNLPLPSPPPWYDFNGNHQVDPNPYVLSGFQCLVWFLGGVPDYDSSGTFTGGLTGFGRNPVNPFTNSSSRTPPYYEFRRQRLLMLPLDPSGVPAYTDSLGNPYAPGRTVNLMAYFSAYGNNQYDPNDCNVDEPDDAATVARTTLASYVGFPVVDATGTTAPICISPGPNPYVASDPANSSTVWLKAQSYQILSSGFDGQYGVGGQWGDAKNPLPTSSGSGVYNVVQPNLRQRESDNLSNFTGGRLGQ